MSKNIKDAYNVWHSMTADEKHQDYLQWKQYVELHHNLLLEKEFDKLNIEIDFELTEYGLQKYSDKDFECYFKNEYKELDDILGNRKTLRYLFENGFTYIVIDACKKKMSKLYKQLMDVGNRCLHSVCQNFVYNDQDKFSIFIKDDELYAYMGGSYRINERAANFCHIGTIRK